MVYKWDGKRDECYQLYVEEKKSLDEVQRYWEERGFTPSKRAFQTQFKRWDFPLKNRRAHNQPEVLDRIKELWETHTMQKDMLSILADEGYHLHERELMRLRAKHGWLLRAASAPKPTNKRAASQLEVPDAIVDQMEDIVRNDDAQELAAASLSKTIQAQSETNDTSNLPLEVIQQRQIRHAQLQAESDELWRTKKRRRRIKGYAGLPADPPGPPRYNSETSLDEAKVYLNLDNKLYREIREAFQAICESEGVLRKTVAGPEKWNTLKQRLIKENQHLTNIFWGNNFQPRDKPADLRDIALDVICSDVTKRMRVITRQMSLIEAKTVMNINPEESRVIRQGFYDLLKAHHFRSKLAEGQEMWDTLKKQWIDQTPIVQDLLSKGPADPEFERKQKAVNLMCRDVMKRWREDQIKIDPSQKEDVGHGPGPGPAVPTPASSSIATRRSNSARMKGGSTARDPHPSTSFAVGSSSDFQIDPSLLLAAANDTSMLQDADALHQTTQNSTHDDVPTTFYTSQEARDHPATPPSQPIPAYFRLHPHSSLQTGPKIWLGTIRTGTVAEIKSQAVQGQHEAGVEVARIEGIVKDGLDVGQEISYPIDDEIELGGYLAHVAGGKVTFVVKLVSSADEEFP